MIEDKARELGVAVLDFGISKSLRATGEVGTGERVRMRNLRLQAEPGGHEHARFTRVEMHEHAASKQKWLECHGIEHWTHFYTDYGVALQKRFFGHFLKGEDTGWDKQPPVQLNVRHPGEKFVLRNESEWPLARTKWTKLHLGVNGSLTPQGPGWNERPDNTMNGRES